jgi:hypothetical protein
MATPRFTDKEIAQIFTALTEDEAKLLFSDNRVALNIWTAGKHAESHKAINEAGEQLNEWVSTMHPSYMVHAYAVLKMNKRKK